MKKATLASVVTAALLSASAMAADVNTLNGPDLANEGIEIYGFDYGGNGCPEGTASALMTPDYSKISMFFDAYSADSTYGNTGRVRKSCNLGISVKVPHGLTVALVGLQYRGYIDNEPGAFTSLQADYFFAGERVGARLRKEWLDEDYPITEDFLVDDSFHIGSIVWSPCGEDAIIRANTSIRAYQGPDEGKAEIQLDTVDVSSKIEYQLQWDSCDM